MLMNRRKEFKVVRYFRHKDDRDYPTVNRQSCWICFGKGWADHWDLEDQLNSANVTAILTNVYIMYVLKVQLTWQEQGYVPNLLNCNHVYMLIETTDNLLMKTTLCKVYTVIAGTWS